MHLLYHFLLLTWHYLLLCRLICGWFLGWIDFGSFIIVSDLLNLSTFAFTSTRMLLLDVLPFLFSISASTTAMTIPWAVPSFSLSFLILLLFLLFLLLTSLIITAFACTVLSNLRLILLLFFFSDLTLNDLLPDAKLLVLLKNDFSIIIYRIYIDQSVLLTDSTYLDTHPLQTILR